PLAHGGRRRRDVEQIADRVVDALVAVEGNGTRRVRARALVDEVSVVEHAARRTRAGSIEIVPDVLPGGGFGRENRESRMIRTGDFVHRPETEAVHGEVERRERVAGIRLLWTIPVLGHALRVATRGRLVRPPGIGRTARERAVGA